MSSERMLPIPAVEVLGLPLAPLTTRQAVDAVNALIRNRKPSLIVSANLNYAMLAKNDTELQELNRRSAFLLADGMPLVWASKRLSVPIPERVAGSDFLFALAEESAIQGHRVLLLGGRPGVAATAGMKLQSKYPSLQIVGIEVPPFGPMSADELSSMGDRIRKAKPDLLIAALSQPSGEKWLMGNLDRFNVPVSLQIGASLDFAAGVVRRSPKWIAKIGLEWAFRLLQEPKRLFTRYCRNIGFFLTQIARTSNRTINIQS
jgi:N-acetylglucosaminyldiphosphoundecaprenol N-acetyl-beta-D-mannosaminyltransferase